MKIEKKPMPLLQKIFYILSFAFLIGAFIYLGTQNYQTTKNGLKDSERFTKEFGITSNNIYTYKNAKEILEILNTGSAVIFFGFPENKWSSPYAEMLNRAAEKTELKEILYYNIYEDRYRENYYYENIVKKLEPYLPVLDDDKANIYAPTLLIVKNGEVITYDDETSINKGNESVEDYWTHNKEYLKELKFQEWIKEFLEAKE